MISYFLQVGTAWCVFILIYQLILRQEKYFKLNRWYLLGSIVAGLILPIIPLSPDKIHEVTPVLVPELSHIYHTQIESISALSTTEISTAQADIISWSWSTFLFSIYLLGVLIMLGKSIHSAWKLVGLINKGSATRREDYIEIKLASDQLPFSFFRYVCIGNLANDDMLRENILNHELHHVRSRHSLDILFVEVIKIIFWWNPIIYMFKSAIEENHEYSADAKVLQDYSRKAYCQLLMKTTFPGVNLQLSNPFFQSFIKKRINMMYQKESGKINLLKYSLPIIASIFLFALFAGPIKGQKVKWDKIESVLNLGKTPIPEYDKLTVTTNDKELTEGIDYKLNRQTGKLYLIENENTKGKHPVRVEFNDNDKPLIEGTGNEEEVLRNVGQRNNTLKVIDKNKYKTPLQDEIKKEKGIQELDISKVRVGQILRINELSFEADATILNPESFGILDQVYEFLVTHENVVIEIGGHTSATPPHAYCDKLSTERAKIVADYITNRGVDASRISYKGYGKRKPLTNSRSASERKRNQRVEVKILAL